MHNSFCRNAYNMITLFCRYGSSSEDIDTGKWIAYVQEKYDLHVQYIEGKIGILIQDLVVKDTDTMFDTASTGFSLFVLIFCLFLVIMFWGTRFFATNNS